MPDDAKQDPGSTHGVAQAGQGRPTGPATTPDPSKQARKAQVASEGEPKQLKPDGR